MISFLYVVHESHICIPKITFAIFHPLSQGWGRSCLISRANVRVRPGFFPLNISFPSACSAQGHHYAEPSYQHLMLPHTQIPALQIYLNRVNWRINGFSFYLFLKGSILVWSYSLNGFCVPSKSCFLLQEDTYNSCLRSQYPFVLIQLWTYLTGGKNIIFKPWFLYQLHFYVTDIPSEHLSVPLFIL